MKITTDILKGLLDPLAKLVGELDTRDDKIAAFAERWKVAYQGIIDLFAAQRDVLVAEAKSEHKLTSTWRPITMLTLVFIVANNYIIAPYMGAIFGVELYLEIPARLWDLILLGVGGYVGGRSLEKMISAVSQNFGKMK